MHTCTCGRTFPGTLEGAWAAKTHVESTGHALAPLRPAAGPPRAAAPSP